MELVGRTAMVRLERREERVGDWWGDVGGLGQGFCRMKGLRGWEAVGVLWAVSVISGKSRESGVGWRWRIGEERRVSQMRMKKDSWKRTERSQMMKELMSIVEGVWLTIVLVRSDRMILVQTKVPKEAPPATRESTRPSQRSTMPRGPLLCGALYSGVYDVVRHSK